jgi:hypothetical protein
MMTFFVTSKLHNATSFTWRFLATCVHHHLLKEEFWCSTVTRQQTSDRRGDVPSVCNRNSWNHWLISKPGCYPFCKHWSGCLLFAVFLSFPYETLANPLVLCVGNQMWICPARDVSSIRCVSPWAGKFVLQEGTTLCVLSFPCLNTLAALLIILYQDRMFCNGR